jgi:hypothetical protein
MNYSLLKEVNKKAMNTYVNSRIYEAMLWPNFFPVKKTPLLTFEALTAEQGSRVAADIVAYNSSAPEKTRKIVSKMTGPIPAIRVKRSLKETDLNTYNILKAQATPDEDQILDLVFGDVDFVVNAVSARNEWLALKALSYGSISLDATNNAGVITENAIDFGVPTAQKIGAAVSWATPLTATPITDFETVMASAAGVGSTIQFVLMNRATFNRFKVTAQVKDYVLPYTTYGIKGSKPSPLLTEINDALRADGKPEILIIDTNVGIEIKGVITYANPWTDAYVSFLPSKLCGNTLVGPSAEETNPPAQVVQSKADYILVSKYSEVDPVIEFTKGEANAFPVWTNVEKCFILKTDATSWS